MSRAKTTVKVILIAAMALGTGASGLWATSAVPEPGAFGIPINPNASGTKVSGPMTVAYSISTVDNTVCDSTRRVDNMFVVATLQQGNTVQPFNRDFSLTGTQPFCFDNQFAQVNFILGLVYDALASPKFFGAPIGNCALDTNGARPCWEVKSVTDPLSTGQGALTTTITLAVH